MIILKNVPFEKQARFLHDNVCSYPDSPEFGQALSEHASELAGVDIATGLKAHRDALRGIYVDLACVEGKTEKSKYAELTNTVAFLYAFFAFGTLVRERNGCRVQIAKDVLTQAYKKGSVANRVRHLEHHGFSIRYLSAGGECGPLRQTSHLSLSYDRHPDLVPALKYFAENIESIQEGAQKCLHNKLGIFLKGDYEAGILQVPIPRDALDPLREDILATVGEYRIANRT